MSNDLNKNVREAVFDAIEKSLSYQLRAVRKLKEDLGTKKLTPQKRLSQPDMVYTILKEAGQPLHISEIISRIEKRFKTKIDKESLVSAITKKVKRHDRFYRTESNTFALLED